jgi:hypothetical protein
VCLSTGPFYVDFPGICQHFGWDKTKLCGPTIMAVGGWPEGNCCYDHPAGCALHNVPKVGGKPFKLTDHKAELQKLGLTVHRKELKEMCKAGGKPNGTPRKVGNTLVYPAPHFH